MKKLLFILVVAVVPLLTFAQVQPTDLSKYHNMNLLLEKMDENFALEASLSGANFTGAVNLGLFGDATQTVLSEASGNTNVLLGVYPMINFLGTAGKVFAGTHNRLLAITADQTNNISLYGTENQLRIKGVDLATGVNAGVWAYVEQSGVTEITGAAMLAGINATVETAATFTTAATSSIFGIVVNSAVNAGASGTIDGSTDFDGIHIQSSGLDWYNGLHITGADNDILLDGGATIDNSTNSDSLIFTEVGSSFHGNLHVHGDLTYSGAHADFAITDDLMPLQDYWAKTLELNKLPAFEGVNRNNVGEKMKGNEESIEHLLRYIVKMEARISELEEKLNE